MIAVINYGMGNLSSVVNAFTALGHPVTTARGPDELRHADRIVLPGVGAFGDGMRNLRERGWVEAMETEVRQKGKPFLGICLGLQLLGAVGTEHGRHEGLGWLAGTVERLEPAGLRVPHIGWNDVTFPAESRLFAGLDGAQAFYFVHSYALRPDDAGVVCGTCDYGGPFVAAVEVGNIQATQFHPEKSHKAGLAVLDNFATSRGPARA